VSTAPALPVTLEDVGTAVGVIARAFHDDALTVHLYPDDAERARLTPLMFDGLVRYDVLFGCVDRLPGFEGVATWLLPDGPPETPERLAQARFYLRDGFELVVADVEPATGIRFWALRRKWVGG
jgi:hypothetical protein